MSYSRRNTPFDSQFAQDEYRTRSAESNQHLRQQTRHSPSRVARNDDPWQSSSSTSCSAVMRNFNSTSDSAFISTPSRVSEPEFGALRRRSRVSIAASMPASASVARGASKTTSRASVSASVPAAATPSALTVRSASRPQPHHHPRRTVDAVTEEDQEAVGEEECEQHIEDEEYEEEDGEEEEVYVEQRVKRGRYDYNDPIPVAKWSLPQSLPTSPKAVDSAYQYSMEIYLACNGDLYMHEPDRVEYVMLSNLYNHYNPERDNLADPNSRIMRRTAEALNETFGTKLFTPQSIVMHVQRLYKVFLLYHKIVRSHELQYCDILPWEQLLGKGDPEGLGVYLRKENDEMHVLPYPVIMEKLFNNPVARARRARHYRMVMLNRKREGGMATDTSVDVATGTGTPSGRGRSETGGRTRR